MDTYADKVVAISGAANGLGLALCRRYAAAGARIVALDVDAGGLGELGAQAQRSGWSLLAVACNVADAAAVQAALAQAIEHFGGIDLLINNAGISHRSLLVATDATVIGKVMEVNFLGAVHLTVAALPQLLARRGAVAAISSVAGYAPLIGRSGYAASKHALHGFFESLRSEVEDQGVSVTLVCPSFIATGIGSAGMGGSGTAAKTARLTSGGVSSAEDIAAKIFTAIAERRPLLLPDRTSRLAWWVNRLAPRLYARLMKRRLGREFEP